MVAGMLTMGLYSALPAMPLPCTTNAVFSWMPTCATQQPSRRGTMCAGQRNTLPQDPTHLWREHKGIMQVIERQGPT